MEGYFCLKCLRNHRQPSWTSDSKIYRAHLEHAFTLDPGSDLYKALANACLAKHIRMGALVAMYVKEGLENDGFPEPTVDDDIIPGGVHAHHRPVVE